MPAPFLEFIWGPRARSISPGGHWGFSEALQASWLHTGTEQTGSDFCPKASVSYRSGCQLGRMSRQQSRCAVTKRNRYHFKHTALERGGRGRKENPIMHFFVEERGMKRLNSALAILEEAAVEDAPYLYSQGVTRLGGASG